MLWLDAVKDNSSLKIMGLSSRHYDSYRSHLKTFFCVIPAKAEIS